MTSSGSRVSVLLPVYNGESFLAASIESVLAQTFSDFELLILNDGSADNSAIIAQSYSDARIRYFEHSNVGLAKTLNKGAQLACGEFLFRQDQDDISHVERFKSQVAYFDAHPDIALLGTWARIFSENSKPGNFRYHRHPTECFALNLCSIFDTAFVHSSVAIRRSVFEALGGYSCDQKRQPPEDFELWSRVCRDYKVRNLDRELIDYREVSSSMSRTLSQDFTDRMIKITAENLRYYLAGSPFEASADQLSRIYHLDGLALTEASNRKMIDGAFVEIERKITGFNDEDSLEFRREASRIRHHLKRNFWLGRSRLVALKVVLKIVFKILKRSHG